jgi:hypothetical protein
MDIAGFSLLAAGLVGWVAIVYLIMGFGVRRGELVWSGRQPRRLDPSLRARSLIYGLLLLIAGWTIAGYGGAVDFYPVPDSLMKSAGWVATAFLACTSVYFIFGGSRWERFIFLPITLFGAVLAGYLTFG